MQCSAIFDIRVQNPPQYFFLSLAGILLTLVNHIAFFSPYLVPCSFVVTFVGQGFVCRRRARLSDLQ